MGKLKEEGRHENDNIKRTRRKVSGSIKLIEVTEITLMQTIEPQIRSITESILRPITEEI